MKKFYYLLVILALFSCKKEKDIPLSVEDIDGNIYKTLIIGKQVWLAENLKVTKLNDKALIPLVTDNASWVNLTTPGYCSYGNDADIKDTYGLLYNWYSVQTGKLCPAGWHVPSDQEWTTLTDFLGGESVAGGKLKEAGTLHWFSPNTGATNTSGFTALPGGFRGGSGIYYVIGTWSNFWTSTSISESVAYYRVMRSEEEMVDNCKHNAVMRYSGHSVRCMMD